MATARDPDVPRLPRGKGMKIGAANIFRILMVLFVLVAIIVMQKPCSEAVSKFVTDFDADAGMGPQPTKGAPSPDPYNGQLVDTTGMTEEQIRYLVEKARQKAADTAERGGEVKP